MTKLTRKYKVCVNGAQVFQADNLASCVQVFNHCASEDIFSLVEVVCRKNGVLMENQPISEEEWDAQYDGGLCETWTPQWDWALLPGNRIF